MKKLKVMIADDEITITEGMVRLYDWEQNNFDVIGVAYDGMSAINLALEKHPDIVIVDIDMPIRSGLEVIQEISKALPDTAFIVASGYDQYEYMRAALKLGVVDYILKPIKFDELHKILEHVRMNIIDRMPVKEKEIEFENKNNSVIYSIVEYINSHLAEEITLKGLGELFHINPYYLSQLFKEDTGINYRNYLITARINEAKSLLVTTQMTISQIAAAVGFSDYRAFTKVFKKYEGMLPTEYRVSKKLIGGIS